MESVMERERSLKKLHFCIANYSLSSQEKSALEMAQIQLREKIQFKFTRASANFNYVFPRKQQFKDEFTDVTEVVHLHQQNQHQDNQFVEQKQKLKIKLAKGRNQKRLQTEHIQRTYEQQKSLKKQVKVEDHQPLNELFSNHYVSPSTQPLKQRVKTDYNDQENRYRQERYLRKQHSPAFINSLQRQKTNSRGKSKLNMLTKSYMNLKSNKLQQDQSLGKLGPNSIRANDYKMMPSSTNHRTYNTQNLGTGPQSNRQLRDLLQSNNINFGKTTKNPLKEVSDLKNLQKIESLLPGKRYFKAR